jgi:hypothetical protein
VHYVHNLLMYSLMYNSHADSPGWDPDEALWRSPMTSVGLRSSRDGEFTLVNHQGYTGGRVAESLGGLHHCYTRAARRARGNTAAHRMRGSPAPFLRPSHPRPLTGMLADFDRSGECRYQAASAAAFGADELFRRDRAIFGGRLSSMLVGP